MSCAYTHAGRNFAVISQKFIMAQHQAKIIVHQFIDALNTEDFQTARSLADPAIDFIGVMGTRHGADAYFADMEKMKFKYEIKKTFADDNDVCLWYDINMGAKTILGCGWYHLVDGRIREFRVLFDPRPLL
jgi:SnoaL-like domain